MISAFIKRTGPRAILLAMLFITGAVIASVNHLHLPVMDATNDQPLADTIKKDTVKYTEYKGLPLKPARKIAFTTQEGTWMSVDISPDGQTIVFDLMGDIYTVPATGGKATPVTKGIAFDTHPRYSPDGKKILFTSDRSGSENVWYIDTEKQDTVQVTKDRDQAGAASVNS